MEDKGGVGGGWFGYLPQSVPPVESWRPGMSVYSPLGLTTVSYTLSLYFRSFI